MKTAFAAEALHPEAFLPPARPWRGASEALVAKPDDPWITPSEATGLTDTPNYEETVAYLRRLAAASPLLDLQEFGRTAQGRPLYLVIASQGKAFTPEAVRLSGKPALLAQAGIHSGEIDGKDAGLMLLRDLAFRGKAGLLDHVQFLFVPIFNADGHERASEWNRPNQRGPVHQGWRTTAQNLNLNRDYTKADSAEMQAMLRLLNEWSPGLYLDLHVTDGSDYQYDITFGYNGDLGGPAWSPQIGAWLNQFYRPAVEGALLGAGHIPGPLVFEVDGRDPKKGFVCDPAMPRFSTGYGDLRHLPTVLVENHSLKTHRQRVLGTYVLLEASLRAVGEHADTLRQAIAADASTRPGLLPFNWVTEGAGETHRDFLGMDFESYLSPASGRAELRWLSTPRHYTNVPVRLGRPSVQFVRPQAYWVPGTSPEVIKRLRFHGIQMETVGTAQTLKVQMYRLVNPRVSGGDGSSVFEGRSLVSAGVKAVTRTETFPPGSVRVPTDQPLGDLAMGLLEPESRDSFFAWGFFLEILQRTEYIEGYVVAPMAEQMLAADPGLKSAFEAKIAAEPIFAADPTARLQWFYERSPFYDERYWLYPIGVEPADRERSSR